MSLSAIFGCAGPELSVDEAAFFRDADPWGFILFGRNLRDPGQARALTTALRHSVGRPDAPILIDQEGGRVARLGPPHWRRYPPAGAFAELAARDVAAACEMAWLGARLMAHDLAAIGVNVDCAPVLDTPAPGSHEIIGDRAYGADPSLIATLARVVGEGLIEGGVVPVIKHIPGHGRAMADSHLALPVVDADRESLEATDFAPFRAMADAPMAMTAHVVFTAIDGERPATLSPVIIDSVIRRHIGFDGLLMTDDLSMKALSGDLGERAAAALMAGCDVVLHCNGDPAEMAKVAAAARPLAGKPAIRAKRAMERVAGGAESFDQEGARRRFDAAFQMKFAA